MADINDPEVAHNLLLTKAYCHQQLNIIDKSYAEVLRSFNPVYLGKELYEFTNTESGWSATWTTDAFRIYDELFEKQLLHKQQLEETLVLDALYPGKILCASIDETISDGASEAATDRFIDIDDCPPIDTWFYMDWNAGNRKLYAWIPEKFVPVVQVGIDVNALESFTWLDEVEINEKKTVPTTKPVKKYNDYSRITIAIIILTLMAIKSCFFK